MKKLYIAAAILFIGLVGLGWAAIPAPPVNQNIGLADTQMPNVSVTTCKGCHPVPPDTHHYMLGKTTPLGCTDCHPLTGPVGAQTLTISRNCHDCHDGTAWAVNPLINLSVIRGSPGRPHHNATKNSASNLAIQVAYLAINRTCKVCHGDGVLDNYNDGHYVPSYNVSMVTPMADYKINATKGGGKEWGGCMACHDAGQEGAVYVNSNHDTHHYETTSMLGRQCNYCHVGDGPRAEPIPDISSDPNAGPLRVWLNQSYPQYISLGWDTSMQHVELRNSTLLNAGDTVNGTGCEKCHSVYDLHNIEAASPGLTVAQTLAQNISGYGHIGNNSDCNGCHQGWYYGTDNPFAGPTSIGLDTVTPGGLTAGVATDVTLTGSSFVQDGYTTTVLLDGVAVTTSVTNDAQIVASLPALTVGEHTIQVEKGGITSKLTTVVASAPGTITSAKLAGTTLTIDGTGLGAGQTMVAILKSDGTRVASDSITSSTDTQIVAVASQAAVGDTVEVVTPTGIATKVIEAGTVPDSVTVTVPNGGENWRHGTTHTIEWNHAGSSEAANVKIQLKKGNNNPTTIVSSTPNDGSYDWSIPGGQPTGTNYKVIITSVGHTPTYSDTSDNYFTIVT